jgi:REP element-mobilizing transposase RayT
MSEYRHGSHTVFSIHLHIVWITKYRHKLLWGSIAERVRDIFREECRRGKVDILKGHVACRSSGNVTDEVIKAYIEQPSPDSDDVFRVEGEDYPSGESPSS